MIYQKNESYVFVRLEKGELVVETLTSLCIQLGISSGWVQAIGAVDRIEYGAWDVNDKVYHRTTLEATLEISPLIGNITLKEGKPFLHLHVTFASHDFLAHAGHLFEARVNPTLEVFIYIMNKPLERFYDGEIGLFLARPV